MPISFSFPISLSLEELKQAHEVIALFLQSQYKAIADEDQSLGHITFTSHPVMANERRIFNQSLKFLYCPLKVMLTSLSHRAIFQITTCSKLNNKNYQ